MSISEERKGALYALAAAICVSTVFLTGKLLLRSMAPWIFTTFFFAFGAVWYCLYLLIRGDRAAFRPSRNAVVAGLVIGVLDAGMTLTGFMALQILNPAVYGFFTHLNEVMAILVGVILLKERFSRVASGAIVVVLAGLAVMTGRTDGLVLRGLLLVCASSLFFAGNAFAVKRLLKKFEPVHLGFYRAVVLAVVMFTLSVTVFGFRPLQGGFEWGMMALLGFVGPFLNYLTLYNALKRLELGRASVIRGSYSTFMLIGAYVFYNEPPTTRQLVGGIITVIGVMILVLEKSRIVRAAQAQAAPPAPKAA